MSEPKDTSRQSCPVIINNDGHLVHYDTSLCRVLGLSLDQITNRSIATVLNSVCSGWGEQWKTQFNTSKNPILLESTDPDGNSIHHFSVHINYIHCGDQFALSLTRENETNPNFDGSIKDLLDDPSRISELFLRLQRAESRLESYMRHFPGVFFHQRTDFSFQYISPNFERLVGFAPDRLIKSGSQFLGMIFDKDRDFFVKELRKRSTSTDSFTVQFRLRKPKDDSVIYLTDVRSPVYSNSGILLGYEGVWLDTTRQIIAERKLTSTAWKENLAMLTAGLVHDFSNVMAGIYALSELYHSSLKESDEMYEGLGQIKKSSMEARKLVRRIIDINREEAGQKNYHDPKKLIYEQLDLLKIIFPRGTTIDLNLYEGEIPVYLDDVEFRQILLNLAMNSKDALGKQGKILISTAKVNVGDTVFENGQKGSVRIHRPGILFRFEDNGKGIPEIHRNRIFNSFFTTKEIHKGSGFGLYNVKRMIEAAGGFIDFETEDNNGTSFAIYYPEADFTEEMTPNVEENTPFPTYSEQRSSIVIFSKEDASQFDLVSNLRSKNWEVIVFSDVAKLRSFLIESKRFPNLCLFINDGKDMEIASICNLFEEMNSKTQFVLYAMGINPDEISPDLTSEMKLIFDSTTNPKNIVQSLEKLLSQPIDVT